LGSSWTQVLFPKHAKASAQVSPCESKYKVNGIGNPLIVSTICTPYITLKDGRVIWARDYGHEAFCFEGNPNYKKLPKNETDLPDKSEKASS